MTNAFEILTRFLDRYGDEVEGRALEDMPDEVQAKLRDFARGKLVGEERAELARRLKENPKWISLLAQEVKGARGPAAR